MIAVRIPHNWTSAEANAAITLFEAVLTALWRQYPEPSEEYIASYLDHHDDDCPPSNDCEQEADDDEADSGFSSYEIPF